MPGSVNLTAAASVSARPYPAPREAWRESRRLTSLKGAGARGWRGFLLLGYGSPASFPRFRGLPLIPPVLPLQSRARWEPAVSDRGRTMTGMLRREREQGRYIAGPRRRGGHGQEPG